MRIACLHVPLFPLAARLRGEPALRGEPVGIFEGSGQTARLTAASRRARKAGIERGMTLSQTRALLPDLVVRARDPECERAAQECLLEIADRFSPRVENALEGVVYLDFLPATSEETAGRDLALACDKAGLPAWVGVASSKLAARVAAGRPESPTAVPAGREAEFLAPLPLDLLFPEADLLATLERWGVRSIGDLARLPADEISSRLGENGRRLHEQARGMDRHPLVPHPSSPVFREGLELDWPLVSLEPFLFVARAALDRLCQRLESRGLACTRLACRLKLEPDGFDDRALTLPAPTRDAKTLLTLIRLDFERRMPGASVVGFAFIAHPDRPREAQMTLYGPTALSPDKLATGLARLFSLLGPDRMGSPRVADEHLPGGFDLVDYAPPPPPRERARPRPGKGLLAVRNLRPPRPLEVVCASADGRPLQVTETRPDGKPANGNPSIHGKVRVAAGPWAIEQAWWSRQGERRDYWDVELSDGGIYRIFRDPGRDGWYADGIYD